MTIGKERYGLFKAVCSGFSGSMVGHGDGDDGRSDQLLWFTMAKGTRERRES